MTINKPSRDARDFLEALLFALPDDVAEALREANIRDFSPEFAAGMESFIDGFREHLAKQSNPLAERADDCGRSFGGNVYFTLSGHGCGFWDDRDAELGRYLSDTLREYSSGKYRFEGLESMLEINESGRIDLSIISSAIAEYRAKYFTV